MEALKLATEGVDLFCDSPVCSAINARGKQRKKKEGESKNFLQNFFLSFLPLKFFFSRCCVDVIERKWAGA